MTIRPLRKPWWLTASEWCELLELHGGAPRCAKCGTADGLSVDHIVSKAYGGTNDLGNLQFLCIPHNSQKGISEDNYWKRGFYWDQVPDLDKLWTAQRRLYESLVYDPVISDWFSQPASQIARKLYIDGWCVGSGKTLAIAVKALAYNQLQRMNWPACRRADRILILTKEQAIRDQIVRDLCSDVSGFGILPGAPTVAVADNYECLRDDGWLRQHDAIVACVQLFWDTAGQAKPDMVAMLGKFPLIFID